MRYLTFFSKITFIFFISFGIVAKSNAGDGVVLKATNYLIDKNSGEKTKLGSNTMYFTQDKLMIKQKDENGKSTTILFFGNKNEMVIFLNSQEYMVIDEAQMAVIKQQLQSVQAMMEQMRANMTEEQKKMMDKNFPGKNAEKVTTTYEKGGSKTINGWNSSKYSALENGNKVSELYIASYSTMGVSKADFMAMEKLMKFFRKHLADVSNQFNMGSDTGFMALTGDNPAFNAGVPVKVTTFESGKATSDTIIESVEKKTLSDDLFTIPGHMKKKDLSQMMQGGFGG